MAAVKTYGQQVIENAKTMSPQEREKYLKRKITELDEHYKLAKELGTPVEPIDKAIQEIYEYIIGLR
jgi:hypothetical protein